ncbi:protein of unknown function [Filimonas lacunae]|uniref:Thioredoxin domain-containing protein n=1 Tax=Filimonas lacunae TaxID=477680 RepID=A0A173MPG1_9BACT|nr:thioredoxin-like domain-containing protein [Filimonas lacunae]BAV09575.1 thiol:disulfide interchange protein TlpA [Filimonas lacunae]SIS75448.1 protein of unknown function [Filimonas lacunae]
MRGFLFISALCAATLVGHAQTKPKKAAPAPQKETTTVTNDGYNIPVTITPLKNCWVYIGCYYGKFRNVVDSAWMDENSKAVFSGKAKLPGGIYFLVSPRHTILSEFLMDDVQKFSVATDTLHPDQVVITGSAENALYQKYTSFLAKKGPELTALQNQLKDAHTAADTARIREQLTAGNKELNDYRDTLVNQNPNSMLALFLNAIKQPEPPPAPKLANGRIDSLFPARYVKEHYWDNIPLHDDRLLRTPFFDDHKLEPYLKYYVRPEPDSVIEDINYILLSSRAGKDMFKYLLGRFTDKYINPEIMGQDKVFIFLFNNYFSKGDTLWLSTKQKEYIFNRAYSLMANQIGEQAAVLDLVDTSGKPSPMYAQKAPFTFVLFWDPNCGHCKEMVPRIDSMYEAKWKAKGIKIYAVNIDEKANDAWKKYIKDNHLKGWLHVYQTKEQRDADVANGRANYRQLYDVFQTPTMYLLDDQKRIIAKKLSLEQFDEVMSAKKKTDSK